MLRRISIPLLLMASLLLACNQSEKKNTNTNAVIEDEADSTSSIEEEKPVAQIPKNTKKDTLAYTLKVISDSSKYAVKLDNNISDSTYASVTYPVFKNKQLNDYVLSKILTFGKSKYGSIKELNSAFIKAYDDFRSKDSDNKSAWYLNFEVIVSYQTGNFIVFELNTGEYSGGAHPNGYTRYYNYDLTKNREITLTDIFGPDYKDKLNPIAEKIFRKDEDLAPNDSLEDYFFENQKFSINNNFAIANEGITFFYNTYEIKSYVEGTTELTIPYKHLKKLINTNSILSSYIK